MFLLIGPEDGEGFSIDVGEPESASLHDGPDSGTLCLQLALQHPDRTPFGDLRHSLGSQTVVFPESGPEKKYIINRIRFNFSKFIFPF